MLESWLERRCSSELIKVLQHVTGLMEEALPPTVCSTGIQPLFCHLPLDFISFKVNLSIFPPSAPWNDKTFPMENVLSSKQQWFLEAALCTSAGSLLRFRVEEKNITLCSWKFPVYLLPDSKEDLEATWPYVSSLANSYCRQHYSMQIISKEKVTLSFQDRAALFYAAVLSRRLQPQQLTIKQVFTREGNHVLLFLGV